MTNDLTAKRLEILREIVPNLRRHRFLQSA